MYPFTALHDFRSSAAFSCILFTHLVQ